MQKHYILFDDSRRLNLLPFTFTRPVAEIRIGILTMKEKWEMVLGANCSYLTADYLREKYQPAHGDKESYLINGGVIPDQNLLALILNLKCGQAITFNDTIIAALIPSTPTPSYIPEISHFKDLIKLNETPLSITNLWDIFTQNRRALEQDFELITKGRQSEPISSTNRALNSDRIFIEKGTTVECSILSANNGPIYIGAGAEIMEGAIVRGPFALCKGATLKMGAKIYGPTTIGPYSKVGGEVNNCVIFGNSNKAHDGFLGNSVLGEWCNIGADSNNSNLKNNYANVKLWSYIEKSFIDTGLQFCGLMMGDHSKCGINTMFNTGTVIGVNANIFGSGFPRNFIPSFSWGGAQGFTEYSTEKAIETAKLVYERRGLTFNEIEKNILQHVFEITAEFRSY
ncbi:MAG: glucose-1-phosphate thymidylyltransferase [Bacteroidales bacterium]|nr:MAG: glucose-1-phosphate thymidylyltransferase [Bacteroidales bacterium]